MTSIQQTKIQEIKDELEITLGRLHRIGGEIDNQSLAQATGNVEDAIEDLNQLMGL